MVDFRELTNQLVAKMKLEDDLRNKAYDRSWELNEALIRVEMAHEDVMSSSPDKKQGELISFLEKEEESLDKLFRETALSPGMYNNIVHNPSSSGNDEITAVHARAPRRGNIDSKMENYARYKSVRYYLATENGLLSPNAPCFSSGSSSATRNILTDEEYIGGACIGLCHDLSKIAISRASNAMSDPTAVQFVQNARDTVSNILQELLEFDWRNSPLRRKYDSTKYALKQLETVLYELSVAGALGGQEVGGGPKNKRIKVDENSQGMVEEEKCNDLEMEPSALDAFKQEIAKIKERMDYRDKLRENLIKTSRDGQKSAKVSILLSRGVVQMHTAAILYQMLTYAQNFVITICLKNAIFALHRGNTKSAAKLLEDCENCVRNDLFPIVQEDPTLRGGSFSNVLEEYVEGKLFYCWLHGDGGEEESGGVSNNNKPAGKILMFDEIHLPITVDEYIGGLCDLTGEIGRFAVARGTVRDKESVKLCLETSKNICMAIKMAGKLPGNINKKMNPLQNTVDKITRILYEQSLMEMAGRKFISSMEEGEFDAED
jgi:predicted translin family RNA/ssDNA-binding protein